MKTETLKVSVITVCRNEVNTIRQTIESVMGQDYDNIEYIVVDGKSTDGTIDIVNNYKDKISTFVSEADQGIYDAMNKGIDLSHGDILIFLNANDSFFATDVVSIAVDLFNKSGSDMVYGNAMMTGWDEGSGTVVKYNKVNKWYLLRDTICQQAVFARKKVYDQIGKFDLKYKIAADYDWLLRALIRNKAKASYLDIIICNYSLDGISNSPTGGRLATLKEYDQISSLYFGAMLPNIKKMYYWLLMIAYKATLPLRKILK